VRRRAWHLSCTFPSVNFWPSRRIHLQCCRDGELVSIKTHRFWIEILLLATAMACVLALLIASLGAAAGAAASEESTAQATSTTTEQSYEGMVTCSRCGAKHSAALGQNAADCARTCVRGGASFVLIEGNATYRLEGDLGILARLAGRRARILGELNGNTIRISSVPSEI
jgi:hypothetical protein